MVTLMVWLVVIVYHGSYRNEKVSQHNLLTKSYECVTIILSQVIERELGECGAGCQVGGS
jgi:hypothetical protein